MFKSWALWSVKDGRGLMAICQKECRYSHMCSFYTGCPGRNVPDFGRMFLKLKYTDLTINTYIRSWMVTEIIAREKCGPLVVPRTVPGFAWRITHTLRMSVVQSTACSSHSRCEYTCKVLGTLRTTATLVWVFV